jgi:hypothetical protein
VWPGAQTPALPQKGEDAAEALNRHITKDGMQAVNRQMKKMPRELQIKTMRLHYKTLEWLKAEKNLAISNAGRSQSKKDDHSLEWECKMKQPLRLLLTRLNINPALWITQSNISGNTIH